MGRDSRRSCRDTANETGPSASFSVRQRPQRTPEGTPAVLTSPAASHLTPSPSPSKHCSSEIVG